MRPTQQGISKIQSSCGGVKSEYHTIKDICRFA